MALRHPSAHPPASVTTVLELLQYRVEEAPDRRMYTFLDDGEREGAVWSRADLDRKARAVAASLQAVGLGKGDAALLVYPQGLDFVAALLGCVVAGVIGIPAPAPDPGRLRRTAPRLAGIAKNAGAKMLLVHSGLFELTAYLPEELPGIAWMVTDEIPDERAASAVVVPSAPDDVIYLQYTSGSTSDPKGVMVTHRNVLAQACVVQEWHPHPQDRTMVSWLPLFHDFGLVYGLLHSLYVGCDAVLFSPQAFVQRPLRWLEAVTRYRGISSPTPNFALGMCVAKSTPEERARLDLSGWSFLNGSEPIHDDTEAAFAEAFAVAKFRPEQMLHVYGMAESTLLVTMTRYGSVARFLHLDVDAYERNEVVLVEAGAPGSMSVASCGIPTWETDIRIVDPLTRRQLPEQRVGEVWIGGDVVCAGYWKNPTATEETFGGRIEGSGDGPFLRTGDLGFLHDGELFISGRHKDLIIIHGANKHPQDLEWQIQAMHPAFRPSCSAAFGLFVEGEERLGFVAEVKREAIDDPQRVFACVWEAAAVHGLNVARIALIEPKTLPKTSSGKIQRRLTRKQMLDGELRVVAEWTMAATDAGAEDLDLRRRVAERPKRAHAMLVDRVRLKAAALIGLDQAELRPDVPLRDQGLSSIAAVELVDWLEHATETELGGVSAVFDCPTIGDLAGRVLERLQNA